MRSEEKAASDGQFSLSLPDVVVAFPSDFPRIVGPHSPDQYSIYPSNPTDTRERERESAGGRAPTKLNRKCFLDGRGLMFRSYLIDPLPPPLLVRYSASTVTLSTPPTRDSPDVTVMCLAKGTLDYLPQLYTVHRSFFAPALYSDNNRRAPSSFYTNSRLLY